jgi:hypothetical protein
MWNDATDGRREAREWAGYHHVNRQFADVVIENYQKDDISKLTQACRTPRSTQKVAFAYVLAPSDN